MASVRRATIVAVTLLALLIIAPLAAGPAQAQTIAVTACGQTLGAPGTYQLTGNIGPCPANGVNITSSNVTFKMANFIISGDPAVCSTSIAYDGISVVGPVSGVVITEGTITSFNDGVDLGFVTDSAVKGVVVKDACFFGIAVGNSQRIKVSGNLITGAGIDGVGIGGTSTQVTVTGNSILSNARFGVLVETTRNKIIGNKINDNGTGGQGGGVNILVGDRNKITGNTISNNNTFGVVLNTNRNVVKGNTANGNVQSGISVGTLGASKNKVTINKATGNGLVDLDDVNPACDSNTWTGNSFATDLVAGVSDGGPGTGCIQ
jgi:parallel beta-helix repeat protein